VKKDRFDQRMVALSPSSGLLSSYRKGEKGWEQFSEDFLSEMRANPDSVKAIGRLRALSDARDITPLCYERSGIPCHRYLVRDILAEPSLLLGRLGTVGTSGGSCRSPTSSRTRKTARVP